MNNPAVHDDSALSDTGVVLEAFREEECTICREEFEPNLTMVHMAACGHGLCMPCYADPGARRWRNKCPSCTQPSNRRLQLYRPVESDYEVETPDSSEASDREGDLQPVAFAGPVHFMDLAGGGGGKGQSKG